MPKSRAAQSVSLLLSEEEEEDGKMMTRTSNLAMETRHGDVSLKVSGSDLV
jgi:hypothetical protein